MEKESSRAQSAMAKEFQFMKKRIEEALSENQQLKEQMARLAEQNCLLTTENATSDHLQSGAATGFFATAWMVQRLLRPCIPL